MGSTRRRTLVLVAVVVAVLTWGLAGLAEDGGVFLPAVPWPVDATLVVIAAAVAWAGWGVRAYQRGDRPALSGLRAARTLVLAKATALTGAVLVGWYGGQALLFLGELGIEARRDKAVAAGVAVLCSVLVAVAGLLAEHWCRLPPDDGPGGGRGGGDADARRDEGPDEAGAAAA
ncbi:DUF3180 domain-containing protein [Cellulomonas sp. PhB143]|uniref:DUF3180 domain-containing protein n=1 Tax=Cellulomonas sp. PhB143 TaxID=2485186 RepID=UPI000F475BE1|nr:DUF3180 domain-containing protein [Cellulomonas sp. PhB143]ROS78822.1 uncharacterized protein DUF3180 [Cellulomonas sp. PhB143]